MIDYFERKIRLKDFELWDVRIGICVYSLVIVDEYIPNPSEDADLFRENTVSCTFYSVQKVLEEHREILGGFARQLTEHLALAHCHVGIDFHTASPQQAIENHMQKIYGYVESDIPLEKLWHLNQD